ncbi:inositol monophosphatase family protein [Halorhabdus amylolytica]|uniref:inositol monophosphatase family protein n=1 Tax=Halorhabdus amylolytica TaxID=2559573 RepID=UPI0010AACE5C|nr:inositol monophosphatase [Halorhabdus amylolytica]
MDAPEELRVAHRAAREAGEIAAERAGEDLRAAADTESKTSANDLVTAVDRACQDRIVEVIEKRHPDDRIVAEENEANEAADEGREWIVDPIDGTSNFSTGFPYFCVSVGFRIDGEARVGVVHSPEPALGRTWYAAAGEGAYRTTDDSLDGELIAVSEHADLEGSTVFGRLSERKRSRRATDAAMALALLENGCKLRRVGASALNLSLVAEGSADGYVVLSSYDWDLAAGELILREAGGEIRIREVPHGSCELVASNGHLQDELEAIVTHAAGRAP